jgi:predicted N-acetyltransferase YhbS
MAKPSFAISAIQLSDVPAIARIAADSFDGDRHTEMKALGQEPYDHEKTMLDIIPGFLESPRLVCLKAVDNASEDVLGFCIWGFRGFEPAKMPTSHGRTQPDEPKETKAQQGQEKEQQDEQQQQQQHPPSDDPIKRLNAFTDGDMAAWVEEIMPTGVQCLYVVMLSVSPTAQGQGVGRALIQWGLNQCDEHGVFAWVHSSEPAHGMYAKLGFDTMRSLDINLDDYAPCPPPNEGPDATWGHYVFRYMKYLPRKAA